jgi:hypothetical protein
MSNEHSLPHTTPSPYSMPNIFLLYPPPTSLLQDQNTQDMDPQDYIHSPIDFHQLQSTTDTPTDRDTFFPTSIFMQRQLTSSSYSHLSEYFPPSDIILIPTLFQNLPTTLSDGDIFVTNTSTPPETSTTFTYHTIVQVLKTHDLKNPTKFQDQQTKTQDTRNISRTLEILF